MANTGAPWNIPYVEPTDIPRTYPEDSEDLAEAIAAGLTAAGGLVAVKSAIFTGTQAQSLAAGANVAVTDLTITHETADAANKLIISAFIGAFGSTAGRGNCGIAIHDGTDFIAVGDAEGNRISMTAGGRTGGTTDGMTAGMPSITFVHVPGAGSKTYEVRAFNLRSSTNTININRPNSDTNSTDFQRAVSSLVIQEVKV